MAASKTGDKRSIEKEKEMASADDSSDSESEPEPAKIFHRRISTNKDIRTSVWSFDISFYLSGRCSSACQNCHCSCQFGIALCSLIFNF